MLTSNCLMVSRLSRFSGTSVTSSKATVLKPVKCAEPIFEIEVIFCFSSDFCFENSLLQECFSFAVCYVTADTQENKDYKQNNTCYAKVLKIPALHL